MGRLWKKLRQLLQSLSWCKVLWPIRVDRGTQQKVGKKLLQTHQKVWQNVRLTQQKVGKKLLQTHQKVWQKVRLTQQKLRRGGHKVWQKLLRTQQLPWKRLWTTSMRRWRRSASRDS